MKPTADPSVSLLARLRHLGQQQGLPLDTMLLLYVQQGFLARLEASSEAERFVLKGGLSLFAVPFVTTAAALSAIAFWFGFGLNVSQPISLMIMYARSPEGRSGEALGVRFATDNATKLVGPVIFGAIAAALGVAALFWINAAMLAGGSLLVQRAGKTQCGSRKDEG